MFSTPVFISNVSEERWVEHITESYTIDLCIHPCIFQVPQSLKATKPEAYTPQEVGLGPYHHFSPEVHQMESQKRDAVKEYLKVTGLEGFINFVHEMPEKFDPASSPSALRSKSSQKFKYTIRSFYDQYLDLNTKTLAWIVIIDGIFLLNLLSSWPNQKNQRFVPDILMLENQIPLLLLEEIRKAIKHTFSLASDIELKNEFYRICDQLSPLALAERAELKDEAFDKHMLHYMYKLIVNNYKDFEEGDEETKGERQEETRGESSSKCLSKIVSATTQAASQVINAVRKVAQNANSGVEEARSSGLKVPDNIEKVAKVLQQLKKTSNLYGSGGDHKKDFLAEEIDVPSVSQLHQIARIKFVRLDGIGIRNIRFDDKQNLLYLPVITLGPNSEVILRNLVAYEEAASSMLGTTQELKEYLDLMCGIVDSEKDVQLLRKKGIINGNLHNDEIARIFNGINKSTERPDEKSIVQRIVQKVNSQFNKMGIVKIYKFLLKVFAVLQSGIIQIFPILVLALLALQSFCGIYDCSRSLGPAAVIRNPTVKYESFSSLDHQDNMMMARKTLRHMR